MVDSKWKVPDWMKPGVRVVVARGRIIPVGMTGTIDHVYGTGNGPKAWVKLDQPLPWSGSTEVDIWVRNMDQVKTQ